MGLSALFGGGPYPPSVGTEQDRKNAAIQALIRLATPDMVEGWAHMAYADWWWSNQPEPVRQLRNIADPFERRDEAIRLAAAGYLIDAAIAVWGADPFKMQKLRASYGYKWVPAVGGPVVLSAPGIRVPGVPAYDPDDPPAKSIPVDLNPEERAVPEKYLEKFPLNALLAILATNYGVQM